MLEISKDKLVKRYEYVLRWNDLVERYVKFDAKKSEYLEVDLLKAQVFKTLDEAESFIKVMENDGFEKPEIVPMICKVVA